MTTITKVQKCTMHGVVACGCLPFAGATKPFVYDEIIDASSFTRPVAAAARVPLPSRTGKTKMEFAAEVQNFMQNCQDSDDIEVFVNRVLSGASPRKPAAMDVAPALSQADILQLVVALAPRPAKPAKRRDAAAFDEDHDLSERAGRAYASLHHRTVTR